MYGSIWRPENRLTHWRFLMEVRDPVCGMILDDETAPEQSTYEGTTYYFCGESCKNEFDQDPARYVAEIPQSSR
jgi:YHS domain-containing protein